MADPLPDSRSSSATSIIPSSTLEHTSITDTASQLAASIISSESTSQISPTILPGPASDNIIDNSSCASVELNPINTPSPANAETASNSTDMSTTPPTALPQVLRDVAALSSLPMFALPLLEMGFSQRHVLHAMQATGIRQGADTRRINELVTWLLEHPVSDDEVKFVHGKLSVGKP